MTAVFIHREVWTQRQMCREKHEVLERRTWELGLQGTTRGRKRPAGPSYRFPREPCPHLDSRLLASRTARESISVVWGAFFTQQRWRGEHWSWPYWPGGRNKMQLKSTLHAEVGRLALGPDLVRGPFCLVWFLQLYGAITHIPHNSPIYCTV